MTDRERNRPTADCVLVEDIGDVLERPPGDTARRHLETCPRCRALARELTAFLSEPALSVEDDTVVADLERALHEEIGGPGRGSKSWWRTAAWRPTLAAAAAVFAVVVAVQMLDRDTDEGIVLRGPGEAPSAAFAGELTATVLPGGDGRVVEFRWSAQAGAAAYRIEVYDAGLAQIAAVEAGAATSVRWSESSAALPAGTVPAAWRVVALDHGDTVLQSGLLPFPGAGADAGR